MGVRRNKPLLPNHFAHVFTLRPTTQVQRDRQEHRILRSARLMAPTTVQDDTARFLRQIKRAKIRDPCPGQYVDRCQYSKTGWAIWDGDGACTCQPAKAPRPVQTGEP